MEWSKIKNIIILILLMVNVFLLVQTVGRERQSRKYREEARSGAVEVLRQQGYEVEPDALPQERILPPLTAERDRDSETKLAEGLLGTVQKTDDGVRVSYAGERGNCSFRSDGSFACTFTQGVYSAGGADEQVHAVRLLTEAGYRCETVAAESDGETVKVTVRQLLEETPLFSCTAEATYVNGVLISVEGKRLVGTPVQEGAEGQNMDAPTALVRFMSGMREGGHVFTRVERLTAGYQAASSGRRVQLKPTWSVATDVGIFLMDGATGEIEPE